MRIFLNDRTVEFAEKQPENLLPSDMVVAYQSTAELSEAWMDFEQSEKFRKFIVVDLPGEPGKTGRETSSLPALPGFSKSFREFADLFKYIPAAGGVVKNEKGELLFIHRFGFWDLPKGKIDRKDISGPTSTVHDISAARHAAIREVKEETGLKSATIIREIRPTWHIYTEKGKRILKQTYWFEMTADSTQPLKPMTSEGIFLVKWTPPDAIHCILSHTYASIRELLLEVVF